MGGKKTFVIAEAGVNHNGSPEIAYKMIEAAANAGVDAIKFQTFMADKLVTKTADQAEYQRRNCMSHESQYRMLKRLELKKEYHQKLKEHAEKRGLVFMSTAFDEESIDFLDSLGCNIFKAGSGELDNIPYIRKMAQKNKPMIISTGMSDMKEILTAVEVCRQAGNERIILLHCTTDYPCPFDKVNLKAMQEITRSTGCLVGYSDHTLGVLVPIIAVSMGACVIEKHFTLNKTLNGPDHKASLEPMELKEMVKKIRQVEMIMGDSDKKVLSNESEIRKVIRKSIVARKTIKKGTTIAKDMLIIKRPGYGIKPSRIYEIIGRKAIRDIYEDELLKEGDFS